MTWMDKVSFAPEIADRWLRTKKVHDRLLRWDEKKAKIKDLIKQHPYDARLREALEISETEFSSAKRELQKLQM
jgi:hypothetical protein